MARAISTEWCTPRADSISAMMGVPAGSSAEVRSMSVACSAVASMTPRKPFTFLRALTSFHQCSVVMALIRTQATTPEFSMRTTCSRAASFSSGGQPSSRSIMMESASDSKACSKTSSVALARTSNQERERLGRSWRARSFRWNSNMVCDFFRQSLMHWLCRRGPGPSCDSRLRTIVTSIVTEPLAGCHAPLF